MYYGIVEDINDPLKLGRVKVRVYGEHTLTNDSSKYNIDTKDLGWSQVVLPTNTPAINGLGHSVNLIARTFYKDGDLLPEVFIDRFGHEQYSVSTQTVPTIGDEKSTGSLVCGIFLDDTQQEFLVIGTLPTKSHGIEDNNDRVRAKVDPTADDIKGTYEPASAYAPVYPYNNVYETESGHVKEYDDTPGYERIKERHMSGTQYEIQPNGSKIEKIVRDNYQLVVGHDTLEVKGNVKIIVSGDANVAVSKNLTAQVGQDMTTIVHGNAYTTVDGNADLLVKGDIDGEVRGNIDINVGPSDPKHIIYDANGIAVHHVTLGGYTRWQAINYWFPSLKTDTYTLTVKNMRKVKEKPSTTISGANMINGASNLNTSEINGVSTEKFYDYSVGTDSYGNAGDASFTISNITDNTVEELSFFLMDVSLHVLGQVEYAFENKDYDGLEQLGYIYGIDDDGNPLWEGGTFNDDNLKLVDGKWTYPGKDSLTASFGNIDLHTEGGLNAIIGGEVDITAFQNAKLDIRKNADIDVGGNVDMDVTGTTSLTGIGDISVTQNGIDSSLITIKSEYIKDDVLYMGNIKLDGEVNITGNLSVDKATTTNLTTTTSNSSSAIVLDTHIHEYTEPEHAGGTGDTSVPNP